MNWYYYHRIGLNIPAFWRHILHLTPSMLLPAAAAVLLAIVIVILIALLFFVENIFGKDVEG